MKTTTMIAGLLVAALASACGGRSTSFQGTNVTGKYVLDLEKTLTARSAKAGGTVDAALRQRLETAFDESHYSLDLGADRTYQLRIGAGDGAVEFAGTWAPNLGGLAFTTQSANGEPLAPEDQQMETVGQDGPWLVLVDEHGEPLYLKRL